MNKIVVKTKRLGGGFGGKETRACVYAIYPALAARKLGKPVRFAMDRHTDFATSGKRHEFYAKYSIAMKKDDLQLVAFDVRIYNNCGWSLDLSEPILNRAMLHIQNACNIPSLRVTGSLCKTNIESNTAFRGFGGPQGMFVAEAAYDDLARVAGVTREQIVGRNLWKDGDKMHYGQILWDVPLKDMWTEIQESSEFTQRRKEIDEFNKNNRYKKRGLAAAATQFGISFTATHMNQTGALVHLQKDGTVLVSHGGVEMGQGLHTKVAAVAADVFDLPLDAVYICETATDKVANTLPTAASSGSDLNGAAVKIACEDIYGRLETILKKHRPAKCYDEFTTQEEIDTFKIESMSKAVTEAWFARIDLSAHGFFKSPVPGMDWTATDVNQCFDMPGQPFWYYAYGVACSEVEIDCLTGDHVVLRSDIVHDVGESINAAIDIGQVEGGFVQGIGLFTMEELVYNDNGALMTKGPGMYKIPSTGSIPRDFRCSLLKESVGPAVRGSKAVGEPPLFLAVTVFYAIKDAVNAARADHNAALSGSFRFDSPATPERIRMACLDNIHESEFPKPEGSFNVVGQSIIGEC